MDLAALICSLLGAACAFAAAVWLLVGFNPFSERYSESIGGGYGPSDPVGLRILMQEQNRAAALVTVGAVLQLAGALLAILARG